MEHSLPISRTCSLLSRDQPAPIISTLLDHDSVHRGSPSVYQLHQNKTNKRCSSKAHSGSSSWRFRPCTGPQQHHRRRWSGRDSSAAGSADGCWGCLAECRWYPQPLRQHPWGLAPGTADRYSARGGRREPEKSNHTRCKYRGLFWKTQWNFVESSTNITDWSEWAMQHCHSWF